MVVSMRTSRTLPAVLVALCAVLTMLIAGCSSTGDDDAGGQRVVKTDQGDVTIPTAPKRVVLLNYALAGYLFDLDVPVVATTPAVTDGEHEYDDAWADEAKKNDTQFLPWSNDGFDMESILDADPDLIIAGGIGFPLKHATTAYDRLSEIAPTVIVSGDLTEWRDQYKFLADDVFGQPEKYDEAVAAYDRRVAEVREAITVPEGESTFLTFTADGRAFVSIENRGLPKEFASLGFRPAPLFATGKFEPYTEGGDSFALSTEQVGQVVTQDTVFILGFNADVTSVDELRKQPIYAALPAFQQNQAYDLPFWVQRSDYDEAMRMLDIVEKMFTDNQ